MYRSGRVLEMAKQLAISAARKALFDLFDWVTSIEGGKVVIGHRSSPKHAVLVDKEYIDHLEFTGRQRKAAVPGKRFSLFGSATLHVHPEEVLTVVRRRQADLAEAKRRKLVRRQRVP